MGTLTSVGILPNSIKYPIFIGKKRAHPLESEIAYCWTTRYFRSCFCLPLFVVQIRFFVSRRCVSIRKGLEIIAIVCDSSFCAVCKRQAGREGVSQLRPCRWKP
jgi:hypothetical protein